MNDGLGSFLAPFDHFRTFLLPSSSLKTLSFYSLVIRLQYRPLHLLLPPSAALSILLGRAPHSLKILAYCSSLQNHFCHISVISKSLYLIVSVLCILSLSAFTRPQPTTSIARILIFFVTHVHIHSLSFKHPINWLPCTPIFPAHSLNYHNCKNLSMTVPLPHRFLLLFPYS